VADNISKESKSLLLKAQKALLTKLDALSTLKTTKVVGVLEEQIQDALTADGGVDTNALQRIDTSAQKLYPALLKVFQKDDRIVKLYGAMKHFLRMALHAGPLQSKNFLSRLVAGDSTSLSDLKRFMGSLSHSTKNFQSNLDQVQVVEKVDTEEVLEPPPMEEEPAEPFSNPEPPRVEKPSAPNKPFPNPEPPRVDEAREPSSQEAPDLEDIEDKVPVKQAPSKTQDLAAVKKELNDIQSGMHERLKEIQAALLETANEVFLDEKLDSDDEDAMSQIEDLRQLFTEHVIDVLHDKLADPRLITEKGYSEKVMDLSDQVDVASHLTTKKRKILYSAYRAFVRGTVSLALVQYVLGDPEAYASSEKGPALVMKAQHILNNRSKAIVDMLKKLANEDDEEAEAGMPGQFSEMFG
tara:strand:- start:65819 stop:67051 length:1233 start_codon:yes stop_codon:yes gene_type:complete